MSLQIPDDYNAEGLAPVVYLYDQNLQLQYTYQHPQIIDAPQQDFVLTAWQIATGINSNAGSCSITIEDHDNTLAPSGILAIRPGWHIQILLGKDAEGLESWFFGVVNEPTLQRPGYGQQIITVNAYGYAHTLSSRFVTMKHEQSRDANGDLDNTDMSACVSELVKAVFDDASLVIPPPDTNITLDGIDSIDVKLASLDKVNQSQGIVISELANVVNAVYGITPDLDFYFFSADQHGGYTITNGDATNIDPDKLMLMRNQPYDIKDTIVRKAFTSLIGLDVTEQLDLINNPGGATAQDLASDEWYGWQVPYAGALSSGDIELAMRKPNSGTPDPLDYMIYEGVPSNIDRDTIWEFDGNFNGTGTRGSSIVYSGTIQADTLDDLDSTLRYVPFPVRLDTELSTTDARIIFLKFQGSTRRGIDVARNTSESQQYLATQGSSSSFTTLTPQQGQAQMRVRSREQILLKAQNLTTQRQQQPKEQVQYLPDTPPGEAATRIFEGLLDQAGQIRRIYSSVVVSAPNTRPPMGKQIRLIDTHNDLDTNPLLIGMDIQGNRQGKLTAISMTLELEQYV